MSPVLPPPRGLLWASARVEDGRVTGLDVGCDCGTACLVNFDGPVPAEGIEVPYLCHGCQSVTWLTIPPLAPLPRPCLHADDDGRGMHILAPGEECPRAVTERNPG